MIEIPLYMLIAPALAVFISLLFAKKDLYYVGPVVVFFLLSLPAVILPFTSDNVEIGTIIGWALLFSFISVLMTSLLRVIVPNREKKNPM